MTSPNPTTIVQVSDLHLLSTREGTLNKVPSFESCRRVFDRLRREVADPARIALTGDLSHEHTVDGYRLVQELLGSWTDRALPIPGNHDDRAALRTVFDQVPGDGADDVGFCSDVNPWRLIGLDTHVPGEIPGALSDAMLTYLDSALRAGDGRPALIFMHHPPISVNSTWLDALGLQNPEALEAVLRNHSTVRGIFCGHIHHVFEGEFVGIPVRSAPAASFQVVPGTETAEFDDRPPGFRIIELGDTDFQTQVVRLDANPFKAQKE